MKRLHTTLIALLMAMKASSQVEHKEIPLPIENLELYFFSTPEDSFYTIGEIEYNFDSDGNTKIFELSKTVKEKYPRPME